MNKEWNKKKMQHIPLYAVQYALSCFWRLTLVKINYSQSDYQVPGNNRNLRNWKKIFSELAAILLESLLVLKEQEEEIGLKEYKAFCKQ